jgi:DNA invertase Pin-like site-specific DNA recombinase
VTPDRARPAGPLPAAGGLLPLRPEKVQAWHRERLAVVYVRQSTGQQVLDHRESTRLQYGLTAEARALGWAADRVLVIDDDLGTSGTSAAGRVGFQRLVAEVGLDHVGLILGAELSRLARSSADWHRLLEVCALFGTLLADADGVDDPAGYNDRLLLGLKGTMSEAELHRLRLRLHQSRLNRAWRGELAVALPIGYVRRGTTAGARSFPPCGNWSCRAGRLSRRPPRTASQPPTHCLSTGAAFSGVGRVPRGWPPRGAGAPRRQATGDDTMTQMTPDADDT